MEDSKYAEDTAEDKGGVKLGVVKITGEEVGKFFEADNKIGNKEVTLEKPQEKDEDVSDEIVNDDEDDLKSRTEDIPEKRKKS